MFYQKLFSTIVLSLCCLVVTAQKASVEEGKKLYKSKCTSCHAMDKKLVGPPLKGTAQKYDLAWFTKWVRSSSALIKSGDKKAVALFNANKKIPMTDNKDLSSTQIQSIYLFLQNPN